MSNKYENALIDAIQLIVDNAVASANYDRTIQATVISCEDETIGKYKVKYQDSIFYAYSTSTDVKYNKNKIVYILVPGNDMSKEKTILGTAEKLGSNYAVSAEGEEAYSIVGNNCIETLDIQEPIELCSYKKATEIEIYKYTNDDIINQRMREYLTQSSNMICSANFQTKLEIEQQTKGDYGLSFELVFNDNAAGGEVTRTYVLNTIQMVGQPYLFKLPSKQSVIFNIDGSNFVRLNKITAFCYKFPNEKENMPNDIFISDLSINGANILTQNELNGVCVTFVTKKGTFFDGNDLASDTRSIEAEVRVKGKIMTEQSNQVKYYWFKENSSIDMDNKKYNQYGGLGWECLNEFNSIDDNNVEWVPANNTWIVKKENCKIKETRYKCVVNYNGDLYSRIIIIKNLNYNYDIILESNGGTQFYFDNGKPNIICKVLDNTNKELDYTKCGFIWSVTDSSNNTTFVSNVERIYRNYPIDTIINFTTVRCAVYYEQVYIGTGSIVLYNQLSTEGAYTLAINNGDQIFQYDEYGTSPTSPATLKQKEILPLSFTLYDNLGNPLSDDILETCKIEWWIPKKDTMINIPSSVGDPDRIEDGYDIYTQRLELNFDIASIFMLYYQNNMITLKVQYKDLNLSAITNFTFTKQGDIGTNGTNYTCKIIPNTNNDKTIPKWPVYTVNSGWNFTPKSGQFPFKIQLYDGRISPIFSGYTAAAPVSSVKWEILKNKNDDSGFIINGNNLNFNSFNANSALILKGTVTYNGKYYYATIPIIVVQNIAANYKAELDLDSGYHFVKYANDGTRPEYPDALGNYPFRINIYNNNQIQDAKNFTFSWVVEGGNLSKRKDSTTNEINIKPSDKYDGSILTNKIRCTISRNGTTIAVVVIPIHLYLNRYGLAAINDWDGNSVSIDANGNSTILAPQIGAGKKDNNNTFTGIVMGQVKTGNVTDTGLFGYGNGIRTIFLDADTGKAEFGAQGKGQIILDPTNNKAIIESGSYANNGTTGMQINLTDETIKTKSGKFTLNADGTIKSTGGTIGGYTISEHKLVAGSGNGTVGMCSKDGDEYAFWAGNSSSKSAPFRVGHDGALHASNANITGTITANAGRIGNWSIENGKIVGGNITLTAGGSISGPNWSINNNGTANFTNVTITNGNYNGSADLINFGSEKFGVNSIGEMWAKSGSIGNWSISGNQLRGGNIYAGGISGSTITGGSINITTKENGYLRAGLDTTHVDASGLNIGSAGINMQGNGIVNISRTNVQGIGDGATHSFGIRDKNGGVHYFAFYAGILTSWSYSGGSDESSGGGGSKF